MSTTESLIDAVVNAARNVEFWSNHGNHGDGHLAAAKRELSNTRRNLTSALNQTQVTA